MGDTGESNLQNQEKWVKERVNECSAQDNQIRTHGSHCMCIDSTLDWLQTWSIAQHRDVLEFLNLSWQFYMESTYRSPDCLQPG